MNAFHGGFSSFRKDEEVLKHKLAPNTLRRSWEFIGPYKGILCLFLVLVVLDASLVVVNQLLYRQLINKGILSGNAHLVLMLALAAAGVSILDSGLTFVQRHFA